METAAILQRQRAFFDSGWTREVSHRLSALKRLKRGIRDMEQEIAKALACLLYTSRCV